MSPDDEIGKSTALSNNIEDHKNKLTIFPNFECLQEDHASRGDKIASKKTNCIEENKLKIKMESYYSE